VRPVSSRHSTSADPPLAKTSITRNLLKPTTDSKSIDDFKDSFSKWYQNQTKAVIERFPFAVKYFSSLSYTDLLSFYGRSYSKVSHLFPLLSFASIMEFKILNLSKIIVE
jgi:hypothetical protein